MPHINGWNVEDFYYFSLYKDAKDLFKRVCNSGNYAGASVSVTDLKRDYRKDFAKL